jgi:hypothetical protein
MLIKVEMQAAGSGLLCTDHEEGWERYGNPLPRRGTGLSVLRVADCGRTGMRLAVGGSGGPLFSAGTHLSV